MKECTYMSLPKADHHKFDGQTDKMTDRQRRSDPCNEVFSVTVLHQMSNVYWQDRNIKTVHIFLVPWSTAMRLIG